jgi:putative transposase
MLISDYPKWSTVKSFYYRAVESGLWEKVMDILVRKTRLKAGRKAEPSYTLIDSQSTKTTYAADDVGIDGGKKGKGS